LRDELYEGSWEKMLEDLKNRLQNKPYLFKLASRIESDVGAIEKLRSYEQAHDINLKDYLA